MSTDLTDRAGLPEDLRFLLAAYPRRIWGDHPNFGPTTKFYLDRHAMFREVMEVLRTLTREGLERQRDAASFGRDLSRVGGFFFQQLHTHHSVEDQHYFPALQRLEPRLTRGFEILDRDHHHIHDALDAFAADANTALQAVQAGSRVEAAQRALAARLTGMEKVLDRHLSDEEEIVIPVMLDKGEAALGL